LGIAFKRSKTNIWLVVLYNHLEKYEFVSWEYSSQYMEKRFQTFPNHQPDICLKPPNEISPPDGPSTNPFNKKSTLKCKSHWIGLRGNLQETAETPIFNGKNYAFL